MLVLKLKLFGIMWCISKYLQVHYNTVYRCSFLLSISISLRSKLNFEEIVTVIFVNNKKAFFY